MLPRKTGRYFSEIQIKIPEPKKDTGDNGIPKFKPEFKLSFDAKGRFLMFDARMSNVRLVALALALAAGFCIYQIVYKWDSHYRITNILIVLAGTGLTLMTITGLFRMRLNVSRMYLLNSGKEIMIERALGIKSQTVSISSLQDATEVLKDSSMPNVPVYLLFFDNNRLILELPNAIWYGVNDQANFQAGIVPPEFKHHKELFDAVLARREIDLDDQ